MAREITEEDMIAEIQGHLSQWHFESALRMRNGEIPSPSAINGILNNSLMKNCPKVEADEIDAYLNTFLYHINNKRPFQYDYGGLLYNENGEFLDTWSTFSYIIESCFAHFEITTGWEMNENFGVIKHPNCSMLMNFYVSVITKFLSVEDLFENQPVECLSFLFFWLSVASKHHKPLVAYANIQPFGIDEFLKNLQKVFDHALKVYVVHPNISPVQRHLLIQEFSSFFEDENSLSMFGALTELHDLHTKTCQHIMYNSICDKKLWQSVHNPLTLKTIIYPYFFDETFEVNYQPLINKETREDCRSEAQKQMEIFFKNDSKGNTELHSRCCEDDFGVLAERVNDNDPKIYLNTKNDSLRTPLHVACLAASFFSVECLLQFNEEVSSYIDLEAADKYGFTPLHCAVYSDAVEIARLLLKHGGSPLLALKDNFGREPIAYASSESMKELLLSFELPFKFDKTDYYVDGYKDQEQCHIFLHGIYTILKNYVESFKLDKYKKGVTEELSHREKKCSHFVHNARLTDGAVCDEDASVFECLPAILDHFLQSIQRISEETGYDTRTEILPLVIFRNKFNRGA